MAPRSGRDEMRQALVPDEEAERLGRQKRESEKKISVRNLAIAITCTSCIHMLYGYDFGITAWAVLSIESKGEEDVSAIYEYLDDHLELLCVVVAGVALGGAIGGLASFKMDTLMGRRAEMTLILGVCCAGAFLEGISGVGPWERGWLLALYALARLTYGFGLGVSLRTGPSYLREVVPATIRDSVLVTIKLAMVVGMIVGYVIGDLVNVKVYGYFGAVVICLIGLMCLQFLPETPLYMLLNEDMFTRQQILNSMRFMRPCATELDMLALRDEELRNTLAYIPGRPKTRSLSRDGSCKGAQMIPAFDAREKAMSITIAEAVREVPSVVKAPEMRASLILTAGLMIFEQASGMTALLYYGGVFLADIDLISVDAGLGLMGFLQLLVAFVVMFAVKRIGRKPLLDWGVGGMALSAFLLALGSYLGLSSRGRWWALIGLYLFIITYSLSLGAIVWVLVGEAFPTCHRGEATSIVATAHFTTCAIFIILLPVMEDNVGYGGMFTVFFVIAIFANIFSHRFMVETRGLKTTEIQEALSKVAWPARQPNAGMV